MNTPRYDAGGQRVTSCCGAYSTYSGAELVCKVCFYEVPAGEGDGTEFREGVTADSYYQGIGKRKASFYVGQCDMTDWKQICRNDELQIGMWK